MKFTDFLAQNPAPLSGEIGIEIEVEGHNMPEYVSGWHIVGEGSLRGDEACEFITQSPIKREQVPAFIRELNSKFALFRTELDFSERTSVHIHINCRDLHVPVVFNFICLFYLFEDMLVHYCGESRKGNLFCLRMRDAEAILGILCDMVSKEDFAQLDNHSLRYASLNVNALAKFGSLEFRCMRGTSDENIICNWIELLLSLKDFAKTIRYPSDIPRMFSEMGVKRFTENIFKKQAPIIFSFPDWERKIWKRLRPLQMLMHAGDWKSLYFQQEPDNDI